jgi:hypothetical protein
MQLDAWWMVSARDSDNNRDTQKAEEADDISTCMDRSINDSKVNSLKNEASEKRRVEGRKDGINVGEYCGHYCLC